MYVIKHHRKETDMHLTSIPPSIPKVKEDGIVLTPAYQVSLMPNKKRSHIEYFVVF